MIERRFHGNNRLGRSRDRDHEDGDGESCCCSCSRQWWGREGIVSASTSTTSTSTSRAQRQKHQRRGSSFLQFFHLPVQRKNSTDTTNKANAIHVWQCRFLTLNQVTAPQTIEAVFDQTKFENNVSKTQRLQ